MQSQKNLPYQLHGTANNAPKTQQKLGVAFSYLERKNTIVIWPDSHMPQENELMYGEVLKYKQLFLLWATHFGKSTLKTLLESVVLICCNNGRFA